MSQTSGKKAFYIANPVTGWAQMPYNTKEVLTESGEWESPITGWVKVTCIGGGAPGASLHNGWYLGNTGGKTSFSGVESNPAPIIRLAFGGSAAIPVTEFIYVSLGDIIPYIVGAGGIASFTNSVSDISEYDYAYPGGPVCNEAKSTSTTDYFGFGKGASNGTLFGGGGGSAGDTGFKQGGAGIPPVSGLGAGGGSHGNVFFGSTASVRGPVLGGNGGAGAIILEYADPKKKF